MPIPRSAARQTQASSASAVPDGLPAAFAETEAKQLDPWSDDGCRDYVLNTALRRLSICRAALSAKAPISSDVANTDAVAFLKAWCCIFGGIPACSDRHHQHRVELVAEEEWAHHGNDSGALPGNPVPEPSVGEEPPTAALAGPTPSARATASEATVALRRKLLGRLQLTLASSPPDNPTAASPEAVRELLDDIIAHIVGMLNKGIVLERFSARELAFTLWVLRTPHTAGGAASRLLSAPPPVATLRRDAWLMDLRNHYYELMKSPRRSTAAAPPTSGRTGREREERRPPKPAPVDEKEEEATSHARVTTNHSPLAGSRIQAPKKRQREGIQDDQNGPTNADGNVFAANRDGAPRELPPERSLAKAEAKVESAPPTFPPTFSSHCVPGTLVHHRPDPLHESFIQQCLKVFDEAVRQQYPHPENGERRKV